MSTVQQKRMSTSAVEVGGVTIGGGAPVRVQSMTNTKTSDVKGTLNQIEHLADAGAELVRVTLNKKEAAPSFGKICEAAPVPIIADIHYDYRLALMAIAHGASAVRINPGNIGPCYLEVVKAAQEAHIPLRIGVNAGSLPSLPHKAAQELSPAQKLAYAAKHFVEHIRATGFSQLVVSAKSHSAEETIQANELIAQELPDIPLHLGVTEAGGVIPGVAKNAVALSALLKQGIGDTIRVSLTADPVLEVEAAYEILRACNVRTAGVEVVSCPTCGRCEVDLERYVAEVKAALARVRKPLVVAVMGCVVNGPGEAQSADVGIAFGKGSAALFADGKKRATVAEHEAIPRLLKITEEEYLR